MQILLYICTICTYQVYMLQRCTMCFIVVTFAKSSHNNNNNSFHTHTNSHRYVRPMMIDWTDKVRHCHSIQFLILFSHSSFIPVINIIWQIYEKKRFQHSTLFPNSEAEMFVMFESIQNFWRHQNENCSLSSNSFVVIVV